MNRGTMLLGSHHIYAPEFCNYNHIHMRDLQQVLITIASELERLGVSLKRPKKLPQGRLCRSLWVRDMSINLDNRIYLLDGIQNYDYRAAQAKEEVRTIPYRGKLARAEDGGQINMDGGDVIIDRKRALIFVGQGQRTDATGCRFLKRVAGSTYTIVPVPHTSLHLDCCFSVLPTGTILFSERYVPDFVPPAGCKALAIEPYLEKNVDAHLALNILFVGGVGLVADLPWFSSLYDYIENHEGVALRKIPFSNIYKDNGGVRCLTQWHIVPDNQWIV